MTRSPAQTDVNYRPSGSSNGYQTFNLYEPDTTGPWPVVVYVNNTAFTASSYGATITGFKERIVDYGLALVDAAVTITDTGDMNIEGGGMFWPPSAPEWDTDDIPEKDVIWIVQHLRQNAGTYGIDANAIGLYGVGYAAATLAMWVGLEVDHADSGGSGQDTQSSVPNAVGGEHGWFWNPAWSTSESQSHLRDSGNPDNTAATWGDATVAHIRASSPLRRAQFSTVGGSVPLWIRTAFAPGSGDFTMHDTGGFPTLSDSLTAVIDSWQGLMGAKWLRDRYKFQQLHSTCLVNSDTHFQYGIADEITTTADVEIKAIEFFRSTLLRPQSSNLWDLPFEWSIDETTSRTGVESTDGGSFRRQTQSSSSQNRLTASDRVWEATWESLEPADVTTLLNRWSDLGSGSLMMPLPSAPGYVEVEEITGGFSIEQVSANSYRATIQLQERV